MAITSEEPKSRFRLHLRSQYRYAIIYVVVTFVVLLFLNLYCSKTSEELFCQSKKVYMMERCQLAAQEIGALEVFNTTSVSTALTQMSTLRVTRLIITDANGVCIFDSIEESTGTPILFPEINDALESNDVFSWSYGDGAMDSRAASPIFSKGVMIGCVYMLDHDTAQGALIQSLQKNILSITLILEVLVVLFSIAFAAVFSHRLDRILASMRIIREGDYSHKVEMGGRDELTYLGAEFNDLTDRLQASENRRRQFVSDASHELKTPLASIKLLSDSILQNDMDTETVREFVSDIGNEADRLNRMSQKLLSLTKVESLPDNEYEIMHMSPTVERVVRMLSGIAKINNITIETDFTGDCPILILEDDLYQITFNLVENGIKYNVPGGTLHISLQRQQENAILMVRDSGMGIPADSLEHIFKRFYRVDKARSRKTGGSGLGLSIVKTIVERNNGTIQVESTLGKGSVFTVTFPAFDPEEVSE